MSKFQSYLDQFNRAAAVTDEEIEKTMTMLQLYKLIGQRNCSMESDAL